MQHKKLRVIVRPWQPRNLPYQISQNQLKTFVQTHASVFDEIVYLGWVRRIENGKRVAKFMVATGPTRIVAKQRFKVGTIEEGGLWELTPSIQSSDQVVSDP